MGPCQYATFGISMARTCKCKILDFITYKESEVAGEGIIHWLLQDKHGDQVAVELPGYHIPNADVRLLSTQVLLKTIGGRCHQKISQVNVTLDNGIDM